MRRARTLTFACLAAALAGCGPSRLVTENLRRCEPTGREGGEPTGCETVARYYSKGGQGLPKDLEAACRYSERTVELATAGCERGNVTDCSLAWRVNERFTDRDRPGVVAERGAQVDYECPRPAEVKAVLRQRIGRAACRQKPDTCLDYVDGLFAAGGEGAAEAFQIVKRHCAKDAEPFCLRLAEAWEQGKGTPAEPGRGAALRQAWCRWSGYSRTCGTPKGTDPSAHFSKLRAKVTPGLVLEQDGTEPPPVLKPRKAYPLARTAKAMAGWAEKDDTDPLGRRWKLDGARCRGTGCQPLCDAGDAHACAWLLGGDTIAAWMRCEGLGADEMACKSASFALDKAPAGATRAVLASALARRFAALCEAGVRTSCHDAHWVLRVPRDGWAETWDDVAKRVNAVCARGGAICETAPRGVDNAAWCAAGNHAACGEAVRDRNTPETLAAAEQACRAGSRAACRDVAKVTGRPEADVLAEACRGGAGGACVAWSRVAAGDAPSAHESWPLIRKACANGDPEGCGALGVAKVRAEVDAALATGLLKACAAGEAAACVELSRAGAAPFLPQAFAADAAAVVKLTVLCAGGWDFACLAFNHHADRAKLGQAFADGCEAGSATACLSVAGIVGASDKSWAARACGLRWSETCGKMGVEVGSAALLEACHVGQVQACRAFATDLGAAGIQAKQDTVAMDAIFRMTTRIFSVDPNGGK